VAGLSLSGAAGTLLRNELVVRSWGTESGLPQNTVNTITQTRDGYLWLGTRDGLARFDGVRFTVFGLRDALPALEVRALKEDRNGTLWIGTSGGLCRFRNGVVEAMTLPLRKPGSDTVTALEEDDQGRLWIGTRAGVSLWQNGRFADPSLLAALEDAPVSSLLRDRHGSVWIATATRGLFEFSGERLRLEPGPADIEHISAYCLLNDREDRLWAAIGNGIVLCRRNGEWGRYTMTNGLPLAYISSMAEGPDGSIWAGSLDDGLYRLKGDEFVPFREEDGLSGNAIRSLQFDGEGNLWAGTRASGLNRLSERTVLPIGVAQGLTNDFARGVAQTPDGTLWVGTTGGGLYHGGPDRFSRFVPPSPADAYVFLDALLVDHNGTLWWGAARALFGTRDGEMTSLHTNNLPWLRSAAVTALCDDQHGGLWIGTSEGQLLRHHDGQFEEFPHRRGRGSITALALPSDGALWVGSEAGGLWRIRGPEDPILGVTNGLSSQIIRTLRLDDDGSLWIGTGGGGLNLWRKGTLTAFTAQQGLGVDTVSQIVDDKMGNLWLGSNRGIWRVRRLDLEALIEGRTGFVHPRVFGRSDGMPVEECSTGFSPAGLRLQSGDLCFSTVKGLVLIDPSRDETNAPAPQVWLEETLLNGLLQTMQTPEPNDGHRSSTSALTVPAGDRELEFHFTGISFSAPEKIRFRYRMEGIDRNWIEAGTRRTAFYHSLPPGRFIFRVTAANGDDVWDSVGYTLELTIEPRLWEESWFQIVAAFGGIGLIVGIARLFERRRYHRRLTLLETQNAVERERLRISQDMHDDIGGILTQVTLLSELGQSEAEAHHETSSVFERIGHQTRAAVQGMDEIIWATNPKNDNLASFTEYVCRFADEWFEPSPIRCWQEVPTDLPALPLRADVRHNVFLALKEAINNILKHSGATEVWLRLALEGSTVRLVVEDNGQGLPAVAQGRKGNGLGNMSTRLRECGGSADIADTGNGTRVELVFPLAPPR
jgi:ligand-binding sensor domain-containing protein/signal transduction histidine kinase